jgi:esterase/lipase superfamily enzyme
VGQIGVWWTSARAGAIALAAGLALSACAGGPPKGVLEPVGGIPADASAVAIHVATTRARAADLPIEMFTGERGRRTDHARLVISIPPGHKPGEVEWPRRAQGDPKRFFVTAAREFQTDDAFVQSVRAAVASRKPADRSILVFVHGYNTTFEESVYRFAQIVHDSGFKGVPVLFTWPSRGQLLQYPYDRESAVYSRDDLEATLRELASRTGAQKIDLLAHSMGNFLAMETMRQATIRGDGRFGGKLGQVMLAAPDIDVDVFRRQLLTIAPLKLPITVFVSSDDRALGISKLVWGGTARAGATVVSDPQVLERLKEANITVYDISAVKSEDSLKHAKFADSPQVVQLIGKRLASDNGIGSRGPSLGEGIVALGSTLGATVGTTVGTAVSLPGAVLGGAAEAAGAALE